MKYLFFDVECANCFDGKGKICEFGYLLTDENFNVVEKDNILINPGCEFDKKGFAMRKIKLSMPYSEYYKREKFPYFYPKIKELFDGAAAVGHGTHFDAKYLLDELERYSLPGFDYRFLDTQEIVRKLYGREKNLRLIELFGEFYPERAHEQLHTGLDDAEMTEEILKYVMADKGLDVKKILSDSCLSGSVFDGRIVEGSPFGYNGSRVMGKRNRKLFLQCAKQNDKSCTGDAYSFPSEYESRNFPQMMLIIKKMTEKNLRYSEGVKRAYYVTCGEKEWKAKNAKKEKTVRFDEFLKIIDCTEEELRGEIDVEKILSELPCNANWCARYEEYRKNADI